MLKKYEIIDRPLNIWFYRSEKFINFGDEMITDVIGSIFCIDTNRVEIKDAELFGIGSIIEAIDKQKKGRAYIWGSGFIYDGNEGVKNKSLIFRGVRGKKTLSRIGGDVNNISLGDPGLLANLVYNSRLIHNNLRRKKTKIGVIPHYVDDQHPALEKIRHDHRFLIINAMQEPKKVAEYISSCDIILSSSLHGLIIADSFGVPNIHMPLSNKVVGGLYKFYDYYSATGREYRGYDKKDLTDLDKIKQIKKDFVKIPNLKLIQKDIIDSFPYRRPLRHRIPKRIKFYIQKFLVWI